MARLLGPVAVAVAAAVIFFVPVVFVPHAESVDSLGTLDWLGVFYWPKFLVLMALSVPLLAVVLLDREAHWVPILTPAFVFLNVSALSMILSENPVGSIYGDRYDGVLSLAAGILLFYAAARFLDSSARVRLFLAAAVAAAVLVSLYGILQQFGLDPVSRLGIPWSGSGVRASSTLAKPVSLADYLTLMMGATLALYFLAHGRRGRVLCLAALALLGVCWLYTYTRGAMLGVAVALPVVLFLARRRLGGVRPLLLPLAVLAAAMLAAQLLYATSPPSVATVNLSSSSPASANVAQEEAPAPYDLFSEGRQVNATTRLLLWRDTIPMILDRPLLGHGPQNFRRPFADYAGGDLGNDEQSFDKAHNESLQVAATTGFLGLAAYLWVFAAYFRHAYRGGGWPLLALSGGVLAYILGIQTSFSTTSSGVAFWAILGVSVAITRLRDRDNAVAPVATDDVPDEPRPNR